MKTMLIKNPKHVKQTAKIQILHILLHVSTASTRGCFQPLVKFADLVSQSEKGFSHVSLFCSVQRVTCNEVNTILLNLSMRSN